MAQGCIESAAAKPVQTPTPTREGRASEARTVEVHADKDALTLEVHLLGQRREGLLACVGGGVWVKLRGWIRTIIARGYCGYSPDMMIVGRRLGAAELAACLVACSGMCVFGERCGVN